MEKKLNERGFSYYGIEDMYGKEFTVRESSCATTDAIWIGDLHLNIRQVKELLPILRNFVKTGKI